MSDVNPGMPSFSVPHSSDFPTPKNGSIYVVAHRGAHSGIPENTLAAYQRAIDLGCDFVEIDVRSTKDGKMVSIHNSTIDAYMVGVKGKVGNLTLTQLKALDIGVRLGPAWEGTRIPTFEEILQLCRGKIGIYLDLKEDLVPELVKLVKQYKMERDIIWCIPASNMRAIRELQRCCPKCFPMPDVGHERNVSTVVMEVQPQVLAPVMKDFSATYVAEAHSVGVKVIVDEDLGTEEEWSTLLEAGADGIQTDDPAALINFLTRWRVRAK